MKSFIIPAIIVSVYYIAVLNETYAGNIIKKRLNPRGNNTGNEGETSRRNPRNIRRQDRIDECLTDMQNIFGLRTPPQDCLKIALRDILFDDLRHAGDIRYYIIELAEIADSEDPIVAAPLCFKRAIDMLMPPNQAKFFTVRDIIPDLLDKELKEYISDDEINNITSTAMKCIDELQYFGNGEKDILKNAIKYHKLGTRPEEYANNTNYFFHQPGSLGEVYLNYLADTVIVHEGYANDPFTFCYWTNGEPVPEVNNQE